MTGFDGFHISLSASPVVIVLGAVVLAAYAYFVYKYTIPQVSSFLRISLITIRALILILLLILIFEPVVSLTYKLVHQTKTFIFIDNSISITAKDSLTRSSEVHSFIKQIESAGGIKFELFSFGNKIDSLKGNTDNKINFKERATNFSQVVDLIQKKASSVNSAVILSDGILTDGFDPSYQAEKLQTPIFTVSIGDSTERKDVLIQSVFYNRYIYADKPTNIEVSIKNSGFGGKNSRVTLYEENKPIESKDIMLSDMGFNKVNFSYKPSGGGEKKLSFTVIPLPGESSTANNTKVIFINVLDSKMKVCLIAGSPSEDVSSISDALSIDKNIQVKKLIQIAPNKFWNDARPALIDSSDILLLVDFPSASTPPAVLEKVTAAINEQKKPFFIMVTNRVNFTKLTTMEKAMPFSIGKVTSDMVQVQPELLGDVYAANFSTDNNDPAIWNNLPPVIQMNSTFPIKIGTNVLVQSKLRNLPISNPLIITRSLGRQRSFAILAGDVWRWQLQTAEKNPEFFVNFIDDIVKWLNVSSQKKQFTIMTDKKVYSPGEQINFTAELYDQTFSPIDTSKIDAGITLGDKKYSLAFTPIGSGLYSSSFTPPESGDYKFNATAHFNGASIKSDEGRVSVGEIEIEKMDTRMNPEFLKTLAKAANGEYYTINYFASLINKLTNINRIPVKETLVKKDYGLWSDSQLLLLAIFLFAVEWFIRKRSGML